MDSRKVLIVEDNEDIQHLFDRIATGMGFATTCVSNGRDALRALMSGTFEICLLDIVMPDMDGLEVLRTMPRDESAPRFIVVSGQASIGKVDIYRRAAEALGAEMILTKPVTPSELRRALEPLADRSADCA